MTIEQLNSIAYEFKPKRIDSLCLVYIDEDGVEHLFESIEYVDFERGVIFVEATETTADGYLSYYEQGELFCFFCKDCEIFYKQ